MDTSGSMSLATPALLFPAISLLLLAYTNRFLALASVIRGLHARYLQSGDRLLVEQIQNLRSRVHLIRKMQAAGVLSLLVCVVCMFTLFAGFELLARWLFGGSLVLMMASLAMSAREIQVSTVALELSLGDLEGDPAQARFRHVPESDLPTTP